MSRTYSKNKQYLDFIDKSKKTFYTRTQTDGEFYEHLPKRERMRHDGTWRYKRGFLPHHQINLWVKKFVNKPFNDFHKFVCGRFHKNSIEGLRFRQLAQVDNLLPWGYEVDKQGIIRHRFYLDKHNRVKEV